MAFADNPIQRGDKGADVIELQLRLSGFRGTVWDGNFGPGTELQVMTFQRDVMGMDAPNGIVDSDMFEALNQFASKFPVDFNTVRCSCNECTGFGQDRFEGSFRVGKPHVEAFHRREYPGIHKAILHAYRAACFYLDGAGFPIPGLTSGYRCWIHNDSKGRKSTNHMGKALDLDFPILPGEDKRDDGIRCDEARGVLVEKAGFQIGWHGSNRKALEPSNIAPTWIHMDVRCYAPNYLADEHFVKSSDLLDGNGNIGD